MKGMNLPALSRREALSTIAAAALTLFAAIPAYPQDGGVKNKVVIQVSDGEPPKWSAALNSIKDLQDAVGPEKVEIEVVALGLGVNMLKAGSMETGRIQEALRSGVKIVACERSMRAQRLGRSDMLPGIGFVPVGVLDLMKRQQEGYAYMRL